MLLSGPISDRLGEVPKQQKGEGMNSFTALEMSITHNIVVRLISAVGNIKLEDCVSEIIFSVNTNYENLFAARVA